MSVCHLRRYACLLLVVLVSNLFPDVLSGLFTLSTAVASPHTAVLHTGAATLSSAAVPYTRPSVAMAPRPALRSSPSSGGSFPSTPVLDAFTRADGAIGASWIGQTDGYAVQSNALHVGNGGALYWASTLTAAQEAYVTLTSVDSGANEIDLLLKGQSSDGCDVLEVLYAPSAHTVQVWTCENSGAWTQQGSTLAATFQSGDRLGARANADGSVEVYQNSTLLGTILVDTSWPFTTTGGHIGVWVDGSSAWCSTILVAAV